MMISVLKSLFKFRYLFTIIFVSIGFFLWINTPRTFQYEGRVFGTYYRVLVIAKWHPFLNTTLNEMIHDELMRFNDVFSTYDSTSELARFNQNTSTEPIAVSDSLYSMVQDSKRWHRLLNGVWDPSILPISQSFGFHPTVNATRAEPVVDFERIMLLDSPYIKKNNPFITLDFSSNAKGLAVDTLIDRLQSLSILNAFVDIGGEIRVMGQRAKHQFWRIGIQSPKGNRAPLKIIEGTDFCVATSGNYLNYQIKDQMPVGHILDPRTQGGVFHNLVSVSVLASTCMDADTLATGLFVMGYDVGHVWLQEYPNVAVLWVIQPSRGDSYQLKYSNGFENFTVRP